MKDDTRPQAKIEKTEEEWREQLTPLQYQVAREQGTERPFTGENWDSKAKGTYACVCCGEPLFRSETKYESGSGWPSFYEPIEQASVELREDNSHMMQRIEAVCAKCDAHLGHVFDDGPQPTGQRFCMNGASLTLDEDDE
jgi:peptide-methionine (R)-S-oxide reductase